MKENSIPASSCPKCGYKFDACTAMLDENHVPHADDLSLCLRCGAALIFTAEMKHRMATMDDLRDTPREQLELLFRVQRAIRTMHAQKD